jgi:hypothetical protein
VKVSCAAVKKLSGVVIIPTRLIVSDMNAKPVKNDLMI